MLNYQTVTFMQAGTAGTGRCANIVMFAASLCQANTDETSLYVAIVFEPQTPNAQVQDQEAKLLGQVCFMLQKHKYIINIFL